jgi:DNA-binding MarR family transcriptional regulator
MWLDIFMKSSSIDDVERFHELSSFTPIEINLVSMVDAKKDMLLREFLAIFNVPKSTLTSIVNRLEKKGYLMRIINPRDKRSFGLELTKKGDRFARLYKTYQEEMGLRILKSLTKKEQQQLLFLLNKITSSVTIENSSKGQVC